MLIKSFDAKGHTVSYVRQTGVVPSLPLFSKVYNSSTVSRLQLTRVRKHKNYIIFIHSIRRFRFDPVISFC